MLKPGIQTSEGKTSIGIIAAGCFFIYYILSSRYNIMPPVDQVLANADTAVDIAKTYAAEIPLDVTSGNLYDTSTIMAVLFSMYKIYSKYTDGRVDLKKEEIIIKSKNISLLTEAQK